MWQKQKQILFPLKENVMLFQYNFPPQNQNVTSLRDKKTESNKTIKLLKQDLEKKENDAKICNSILSTYIVDTSNKGLENAKLKKENKKLKIEKVLLQNKVAFDKIKEKKNFEDLSQTLDATINEKLANNCASLVKIIPPSSSIRRGVINVLSSGIPVTKAATHFGVSASTISRARKDQTTSLETIWKKPRIGTPRVDKDRITEFWLQSCSVPSGSNRQIKSKEGEGKVHVHVQRKTSPDLYKEFKSNYPNLKCSFPTFYNYKPYNVKMKRLPTKADLIDQCPHCLIVKKMIEKQLRGEKLTKKEEKLFAEKLLHKENSYKQMNFYVNKKINSLRDNNVLLVVHDFSKLYLDGKRYNDLMVSVLTHDPIEDKIQWLYFDFIEEGKGGKQDFYFVRSIYRWLFGASDINFTYKTNSPESIDPRTLFAGRKVIIFSDGAPQHFKQKKTVAFWIDLQRELHIKLEIHFFFFLSWSQCL
jgi:hypothetical protein